VKVVKVMNWHEWNEINVTEVREMDHEFDFEEMDHQLNVGISDCCNGKQQTQGSQMDSALTVSDVPNSIRVGTTKAVRAIAAAGFKHFSPAHFH